MEKEKDRSNKKVSSRRYSKHRSSRSRSYDKRSSKSYYNRKYSSSSGRSSRRRRYRSRSRSSSRHRYRSRKRHRDLKNLNEVSNKSIDVSDVLKRIEADALGTTLQEVSKAASSNRDVAKGLNTKISDKLEKEARVQVKLQRPVETHTLRKFDKLKKWKEKRELLDKKGLFDASEIKVKASGHRNMRKVRKLKSSAFEKFDVEEQPSPQLKMKPLDYKTNTTSYDVSTNESIDPLEAYMSNIQGEQQVGMKSKTTISLEEILSNENIQNDLEKDDQEDDVNTNFIKKLKNISKKDRIFTSTEITEDNISSSTRAVGEEELLESDDGGWADRFVKEKSQIQPSSFIQRFTEKKIRRKIVPVIDHEKMIYRSFKKNFYIEAQEVREKSNEEIEAIRFGDSVKVRGELIQNPIETWGEAGLSSIALQVLEVNNWKKPFAIQKQSLPVIMSGRDLLAVAKTGSGKTLSFVLPLVRHVSDQVQQRKYVSSGSWCKDSTSRLFNVVSSVYLNLISELCSHEEIVVQKFCVGFLKILVEKECDFIELIYFHNYLFKEWENDSSKSLKQYLLTLNHKIRETTFFAELSKVATEKLNKVILFIKTYRLELLKYFNKFNTSNGPVGLVLAPSRELAKQIGDVISKFSQIMNLQSLCCAGGDDTMSQIKHLSKHKANVGTSAVDILVGTPGRIIDLMCVNKGTILNMTSTTFLILDEADRMFDEGFAQQIERILKNLNPKHQTVLFSATFPRNVQRLARKLLRFDPCEITVGGKTQASDLIIQKVDLIEQGSKVEKLLEILGQFYQDRPDDSALVFTNKQETCDELFKKLINFGYNCFSLHGNQNQADRDDTIERFKQKEEQLLIATSVAGRGLDVPHIKLVVNYNCPNHIEDYIHRIGRTGRANTEGLAHTFLTPAESEYAPDLIRALKGSGQQVPIDLQQTANEFLAKVRTGEAKYRRSGYVGNRGFTFKDNEKSAMGKELDYVKKSVRKDVLGIDISDDEDDKPFDRAAATAKAREVAANLTSQHRGSVSRTQRKNEYTNQIENVFMSAIPINNLPQSVRSKVTSRSFLEPIQNSTGCLISARGRYVDPNKKSDIGAQPLHLYLEATSEYSVKSAQQELEDVLEIEASGAVDIEGPGRFSMTFG